MNSILEVVEGCISQLKLQHHLQHKSQSNNTTRNIWHFTLHFLKILAEELKEGSRFCILKEIIDQEMCKSEGKNGTIRELSKMENELKRLMQHARTCDVQYEIELKKKDLTIREQAQELETLETRNESELGFTKIWFQEQIEEIILKREMEVNKLNRSVGKLKNNIEEEGNIHAELYWYYENEKKRIEELITFWEGKFRDVEERNSILAFLKKKCQDQREELKFFENTYRKRSQEMEEYVTGKERRRREYEYEQFRHKTAIKIQAWWRGVMVRRCLGPYKYLLRVKVIKKRKASLKKKNYLE